MHPPRYLLLNPRSRDLMDLASAEDVTADKGLYAVAQPHLEQPAHWALRLIDLQQRPDVREQLAQWLDDETLPRDLFGGWLTTDAAPDVLRQHFEHQMVHRDPDGQRRLLRFFGPTFLDQIIHVLDPAQLCMMMGPISQWGYLDADRRCQVIERPAPATGSLTIRREQWDALACGYEVNRLREAWQRLREGTPLPDDHYRRIMAWLAILDETPIDLMSDRVAFALLGLDRGWRFDRTPFFRDLLKRQQATDVALTTFLKQMTPDQWARLEAWPHKECVAYD